MEAIELLTADHNRVRGMFTRWKTATETEDLVQAAELTEAIIRELQVHTMIEEDTFYAVVHGLTDEIAASVDEGLEEHHQIDILMDEVMNLRADDPKYMAKMTVLIEDVEHHASEEESELFPEVRSNLDADALSSLGDRLEDDKRLLDAQTQGDNIGLTLKELHRLASEQKIPGRSSMDKEELAATVESPGS